MALTANCLASSEVSNYSSATTNIKYQFDHCVVLCTEQFLFTGSMRFLKVAPENQFSPKVFFVPPIKRQITRSSSERWRFGIYIVLLEEQNSFWTCVRPCTHGHPACAHVETNVAAAQKT